MVENINTNTTLELPQEIVIDTDDIVRVSSLRLNQVLQDYGDFATATEAYFAELFYNNLTIQNPHMSDQITQEMTQATLSELAAVREKFIKYARYHTKYEKEIE